MRKFICFVKGYLDGRTNIAYINREGNVNSRRFSVIEKKNNVRIHTLTMKTNKKIHAYDQDMLILQEEICKSSAPFIPLEGTSRNTLRANAEAKKHHQKNAENLDFLKKKYAHLNAKKNQEEQKKEEKLKQLHLQIEAEQASYKFGCRKALNKKSKYYKSERRYENVKYN